MSRVYATPVSSGSWCLERFAVGGTIRYFSHGRHALCVALQVIGVGAGDTVLVPAFICRDLLAAIRSLGARPSFYPVGPDLTPTDLSSLGLDVRAVIAVNYFGFPQDLAPFRAYCRRSGAVLIEDNAHGLFSRDIDETPLGTRADFGIFSLRKTLLLPHGAALHVKDGQPRWVVPDQLPSSPTRASWSYKAKSFLAATVPFLGTLIPRAFTRLTRVVRKVLTGHDIARSPGDAEYALPPDLAPYRHLKALLSRADEALERDTRRALYAAILPLVQDAGGEPIYPELPAHTVPYGLPFRASGEALRRVESRLAREGLECHSWPDLPDAVAAAAPAHYRSVWMVGFRW